ncbi:SMP-30/gluconolactonase/LRE family protein [Edaphobacter albus]|uniref:SMP-30/gluconolactonase/LRE family protein n=1 Tax=Edaphobacter sp. 4G125 TaxID=2763071 RepID=UPI001644B128|nr:SMP-30/gluconolactonase/LRE family protein [Edaphobacter sp. 4G125]QNI36455.1 SMP-30/gluconolactonase/LRE family protein [Edaphobacter sp. 4G125]
MRNPILDFEIDKSKLQYIGKDLQRPECILAEKDGTLWSADSRGGVVRLRHDGTQEIITQKISSHFSEAENEGARYLTGTLPNGLAFAANGDLLISNFGTDRLEIMTRSGSESKVLADSIDGEAIGKVNFVLRDSKGHIWITVSTRIKNWMHALRPDLSDGYIAQYIDGKFRIVADGFHFTNEIRLDAREEYMYVVETTGGCISRLRVHEDGALSDREVFGPSSLGKGAWPDGIAFDSFGNLWGTCVYSDKLFVLTPDGDLRVLLDEGDPVKVDALEKQFISGSVTEDTLFATGRGIAPWMASVTFGGSDLQTVYIGSLRAPSIPYFRAPMPGLPMVHWNERY